MFSSSSAITGDYSYTSLEVSGTTRKRKYQVKFPKCVLTCIGISFLCFPCILVSLSIHHVLESAGEISLSKAMRKNTTNATITYHLNHSRYHSKDYDSAMRQREWKKKQQKQWRERQQMTRYKMQHMNSTEAGKEPTSISTEGKNQTRSE